MPDIENVWKHSCVWRMASLFPGGPGTAEELLYILGIMMHPENADQPMPSFDWAQTE